MNSETILAPIRRPAEAADSAAATATTHHLTFYGRGNPQEIAAFAPAKVLLEGAIAAEAGTGKPAFKTGLGPRHYIVRLIAGGRTAEGEVETQLETTSLFLGRVWIQQPRSEECGELTRTERSETDMVFEVRPARRRYGDTATASNSLTSQTRGVFDLTVVNGSVTHCMDAVLWLGRCFRISEGLRPMSSDVLANLERKVGDRRLWYRYRHSWNQRLWYQAKSGIRLDKWWIRSTDAVIDRVKVREVAGILRSREQSDSPISALMFSGFDRADLDLKGVRGL